MKQLKRPFRVNEAFVRGVAVEVFLLTLAAIITGHYVPVLILAVDFAIRVFLVPQLSYLAWLSRKVTAPLARFKNRQILFKPKRFAASIGLVMTLGALIVFGYGWLIPYRIILAVLALFSGLEAFFRFCAGCKIFALLIKLGLAEEDLCTDCTFEGGEGI